VDISLRLKCVVLKSSSFMDGLNHLDTLAHSNNFSAMVRERLREQQVIVRQIDGVQTSVLRDFMYQIRKV
jgi:hypothetical protein